jgi:hypothetical protein
MMCTHQILFGDRIKSNEIGGACSTYGGEEMCIQDLVKRCKERRPLRTPRSGWENNNKIYLQEMELGHGLD